MECLSWAANPIDHVLAGPYPYYWPLLSTHYKRLETLQSLVALRKHLCIQQLDQEVGMPLYHGML
jgi:hypothetical protein